jgi:hypothetical protein
MRATLTLPRVLDVDVADLVGGALGYSRPVAVGTTSLERVRAIAALHAWATEVIGRGRRRESKSEWEEGSEQWDEGRETHFRLRDWGCWCYRLRWLIEGGSGEGRGLEGQRAIENMFIYSSGHVGRLQVAVRGGAGLVRETRADGCEGGNVKLGPPPYESIFVQAFRVERKGYNEYRDLCLDAY